MNFFTGEHKGKIDGKGRLVLPARFKAMLPQGEEHEVVLRMGFEQCLQLYPMDVYRMQHERLVKLSSFDESQRALRRFFFSRTVFLSLDSLGRLLLPRQFMDHAVLKQEALLIGVGDSVEIWSAKGYKELNEDPKYYARLAKELLDE